MPRIGLSIGDPNGIGPEVVLKALQAYRGDAELIPVGDPNLLRTLAASLNLPCPDPILPGGASFPKAVPGEVSAPAGEASASWVRFGIHACLNRELDALVTAPICKESWHLAGIPPFL